MCTSTTKKASQQTINIEEKQNGKVLNKQVLNEGACPGSMPLKKKRW